MRTAILATCTLNQWAMDFSGNFGRIIESIKQAKEKGASYRTGPELEITGYNCGDHFYESDTFLHSWEVLAELLKHKICKDIIIDVGMPVMYKNIAYNCRVIFLNKRILLIRPKKILCDNGIYHETRWFTGWLKHKTVENYYLPKIVQQICNQKTTLIGDAVISTADTSIGFEICEELWNPKSSNINHFYDGIEIIVNSSGGFHEIGNTTAVLEVIQNATAKCGGIYLFSNLRGCDGDRMYFHGTSHITCNGHIIALGKQFSLQEVEVTVAAVDLDDVNTYRKHICKSLVSEKEYPYVKTYFSITTTKLVVLNKSSDIKLKSYREGEEVSLGPACWLWDYLRRSGMNGFLLPLDGDIDSSSSAVIVYSLCNLICVAITDGDLAVLSDLRKIVKDPDFIPKNPKELCKILLVTCHMNTEKSTDGFVFSNNLVSDINSNHINVPIGSIIDSFILIVSLAIGMKLKASDSKIKQYSSILSLKEHIKVALAYLIARLFLSSKGKSGNLLVLGSGNANKFMIGEFVKYGCSNGDINLTGGISRCNLESFLKYAVSHFQLNSLNYIINTDKTSEKTGLLEMTSEHDKEIELLLKLRKKGCGAYSAFCQMVEKQFSNEDINDLAFRVKKFFYLYSKHHHKLYSLSPCFHLGSYASANVFYDQRQILYNSNWSWQFHAIDIECNSNKRTT